MARTRAQLRRAVCEQLQLPFVSGTADSGGSTSTLKDTVLQRFADDYIIGGHIFLTSGTPTFTELFITDSVQSTGVATFRPTLGAAPDTLTYEILPFNASAIHSAIDEALMFLYDSGQLVRRLHIPMISGSPIYNSHMAYWTSSSALHGWTETTTTLARQQAAALRWTGEEAARLGTADGTLDLAAPWRRFIAHMGGQSIKLRAWLRTSTASNGRLKIIDDSGAALVTGDAHSGDGEWEVVTAEGTLAAGDIEWYPRVERYGGANVDVGEVWMETAEPAGEYPFPLPMMPDGPDAIYISPLDYDSNNKRAVVRPVRGVGLTGWRWYKYHGTAEDYEYGVITFDRQPAPSARLVVVGDGPFSLPTTDAAYVEMNQMEALLVAKLAAIKLLETHMGQVGAGTRLAWSEVIGRLTRDINVLSEGAGTERNSAHLDFDLHFTRRY